MSDTMKMDLIYRAVIKAETRGEDEQELVGEAIGLQDYGWLEAYLEE